MLQVEDLNQYYGGSHIVRNLGFEARVGEVTVVLGRNGVGKTTLLKSLMGLVRIKTGSIKLGGTEMAGLPPYERVRLGVGYVPQGREIFNRLTVAENLSMGLAGQPRGAAVPRELFELFPVLNQMMRRRGGDLSGGQQQQLAIARALAAGPSLVLLDEPTEGIQPSIIKDIGRAITYLRGLGKMAIVLVEQYLDFARELGDHFVVMDRGSITYSSDRANLDEGALRRAMAL